MKIVELLKKEIESELFYRFHAGVTVNVDLDKDKITTIINKDYGVYRVIEKDNLSELLCVDGKTAKSLADDIYKTYMNKYEDCCCLV